MSDLEEIKQRIDIVTLIGEYITLKKTGRNFKANCPFHSEKTPSFVISPERQIWHCFGACNMGGDIFTFVMKIENIDFPEALEMLAKRAGVKLTSEYRTTGEQKFKEEIYRANISASRFYHYLLTEHKIGQKAREYLKKRGISEKIWQTFMLGYSPEDWDSLTNYLRKKGFNDRVIIQSGLALSGRTGRPYDRFRGRLIFTLRDHRENVVGFSGRKISQTPEDKEQAKYINTSETPVYIKGNVLYGLDQTKDSIKKENEAIIVEGEFDLLSSFQAGVTNIIAIKGSALTLNQANLLKRFTDTMSLALDADFAGDAAARRGIEIADNAGFNIKVINIPSGKDPDECIKDNPAIWKKAVKDSIAVYDFLLQSALSRLDKTSAYGKKKIVDEILPFYARVSNPIVQAHYIRLLAKTIDIAEDRLLDLATTVQKISSITAKASFTDPVKKQLIIEEHILSLFLQAPKTALLTGTFSKEELAEIVGSIDNPAIKKIIEQYQDWVGKIKDPVPQAGKFISGLPGELIPLADKAYLYDLKEASRDDKYYQQELVNSRNKLVESYIRRRLTKITTIIKGVGDDQDDFNKLNEEFNTLKKRLRELEKMVI